MSDEKMEPGEAIQFIDRAIATGYGNYIAIDEARGSAQSAPFVLKSEVTGGRESSIKGNLTLDFANAHKQAFTSSQVISALAAAALVDVDDGQAVELRFAYWSRDARDLEATLPVRMTLSQAGHTLLAAADIAGVPQNDLITHMEGTLTNYTLYELPKTDPAAYTIAQSARELLQTE